jgi:hypothetical protein
MIEIKITVADATELNRELSCLIPAWDPKPQPPHEPGIPREVVLATIARIFRALHLGSPGTPGYNKINAIEQIRAEFGLSLKEAKDITEGVAR